MKQEVKAIYNEDLENFLKEKGELEGILNGNRFCLNCGGPISLNNIQLVIPYKNKTYEYICDAIACVEKYHDQKQ